MSLFCRWWSTVALCLLAAACTPRVHAEPEADGPSVPTSAITHALVDMPTQQRGADPGMPDVMHRFRIPLESTRIAFVDLRYETPLIEALGKHALVINGGYWAYAGKRRVIQGLLVVNGKPLAPFLRRAGGGVLTIREGRAVLTASEQWQPEAEAELALQCKPRLVSSGKVIPKLDTQRRATRTALCIRDDGKTLDAYLTDDALRPTLAELGAFLVTEGCTDALNLDGGPSTAAVFEQAGQAPLRVGVGLELPYGLGFSPR